MIKKNTKITSFKFEKGKKILDKYEIVEKLGQGWEGEVYLIKELGTNIERAAKFFFPHRNKKNDTLKFYARKLHKLRNCQILIQYYTQENMEYKGANIPFLVSEYVEGELLSKFIKKQPGKRLMPFQALHLLFAIAKGINEIHRKREYHGDLHTENIIVVRNGLNFDIKLIDLFRWKDHTTKQNIQDDIADMIKIFYEILGGKKWYSKQPKPVKDICCGLRKDLILKKFRTTSKLIDHIENLQW